MHQNLAGRLTLIGIVLLVGLLGIFWPPTNLFRSLPWSEKINLKAGIDIAGGTSLLYEIKALPGADKDLAEQVASVLKKRVDPEGVKNLVWRPQGSNRLEIQMPASPKSEAAQAARRRFQAAADRLSESSVRLSQVQQAMERPTADRDAALARLGADSPWLKEMFAQIKGLSEQIAQARAAGDYERIVFDLEPRLEKVEKRIDDAAVPVQQIQNMLDLAAGEIEKLQKDGKAAEVRKKQQERQAKIQAILDKAPNFPARTEAVKEFVAAFDEWAQYKGSVDDAEGLKRLLKGSGVLEFRIVAPMNTTDAMMMRTRLLDKGPTPMPGDTSRWYEVDREDQLAQHELVEYAGKKWILISIRPEDSMVNRPGAPVWGLQRAYPEIDSKRNEQVVGFEFDAQGASLFAELTSTHINQPLAIILDDRVISAPNIQSRIEKSGIITGDRTPEDRAYLISTLNAGSLPARLADEPISERTISPMIGADNLRAGLVACAIGLVVVAVFLIGYYYLAGVVATIAVFMNLIIILGVMAMFAATFTLPGIAALVLTVGMAVDANVLIFERLREEQLRGLSLRMALHNAYDRAFSAILDSNVTTAITSLILYWLGSEEVKGFGLTLLIGILTSLFTALFVTRTLFGILIDKFELKNLGSLPLTYPNWDRALKPNIDWMGKAWAFIGVSALITVIGLGAFFLRGREMFDIEFVSGTGVQFELKKEMDRPDVQKLVEPFERQGLPSAQVVAVGADRKTYEVVTPNPAAPEVKAAIMKALGDVINVEQPSSFANSAASFDEAINERAILPIISENEPVLREAGAKDEIVQRHSGGVAIVLRNLDPPLTAEQITKRLQSARLQPDRQKDPYRRIDVQVARPPAGESASRTAVILCSDENLAYTKVPEQWKPQLARPLWALVNEAISHPAELQKVVNFDAQVAGETLRDGIMALVVSILLIMVYIWFRFGNLLYAAATVVALLHDTLITVGAIGISHYLGNTVVGNALLVEPFRMNLTLLAAVLTVMGYSMNDTIVVFDRIRENRGKFGHVSRTIINDSINQTLSRTLLTGGTTLVTILFMYITGGPGIHGFTFALLVGILVGTYSSIAIASPILLLGRETTETRRTVAQVQPASR